MFTNVFYLLIGIFIGGTCGVLIMALCMASGKDAEENEHSAKNE